MHIAGLTRNPDEPWMVRVAKDLTDCFDGFLLGKRAFICDRDTKFTERLRGILGDTGVRVVLTPRRAPNCNALAARCVLSIKREPLNRMVFFGEKPHRRAIDQYVTHYNAERPHQGVGNQPLSDRPPPEMDAEVEVRERLGGLLKSYRRAA